MEWGKWDGWQTKRGKGKCAHKLCTIPSESGACEAHADCALFLCSARVCSRTSAAAAVIAATSKTTNKAGFGAGRGNFVDFYDCLLCGIGCWLVASWMGPNENGEQQWQCQWRVEENGNGKGNLMANSEWKRKVASLRLTPMRLFTQFQIPTQFE